MAVETSGGNLWRPAYRQIPLYQIIVCVGNLDSISELTDPNVLLSIA